MTSKLKIFFVLPTHCNSDENNTSEPMRQAFELCCQNQLIPEWISEKNCPDLEFTKTDIVVFEEFKGDAFLKLEEKKCFSIAGPWCLITCLLDGLQVPNNGAPIYNMSMHQLTITASNYSMEQKKILKEKIEMMGGIFNIHITPNVTHLVTNSVRTQKYAVANERNIKVMLASWVDEVWKESLTRNIKATDEEFTKYKCPIFQNLRLCCTGFEVTERNKLVKIIQENGGSYSGKFVSSSTDILICNPGVTSEKFNVARKAKVPTLTIQWIYDSLEKGYCIPDQDYIIRMSSSTPTKSNALVMVCGNVTALNVDFSMMSAISGSETNDPFKTSASDTINVSLYNMDKKNFSDGDKENCIIDNIDVKEVKEAGTFLAECSIYLTGFNAEKREKLCRILKSAGATRYDNISDRVTQIITGTINLDSNEMKSLKGSIIPIVSVDWLIECIKQKQPVYEEPFTIKSATTPNKLTSSPLSQKGLTLLTSATMKPPPPPPRSSIKLSEIKEQDLSELYKCRPSNAEEDTLDKLLKQDAGQFSSNESEQTTFCALFEGKTFKLFGQTDEDAEKLSVIINEQEGDIIPAGGTKIITDYIVVPPICNRLKHTATEIVNNLWIYECHSNKGLLPLEYYHQPIFKSTGNLDVLKNCVCTISGYLSFERTFLMHLIQYLGAVYQDKFARVTLPDHSVKASTHLICCEATGSKYNAAVRWKIPAVNYKWLLRCAETKTKCDETDFLFIETTKNLTESNKRDSDGKKKTSNDVEDENNVKKQEETPGKRMKIDTPSTTTTNDAGDNDNDTNDNVSLLHDGDGDDDKIPTSPLITVDGGRKITLSKFMQELRDQGLFDTPSPPPKLNTGTPILDVFARLRREGKIPDANKTPDKTKNPKSHLHTPQNDDGSDGGSQNTPVGRFLRGLQERNVITPKRSKTPSTEESPGVRPFYDIKTPDTPYGNFIGDDDPSRESRKNWKKYIDQIPVYNCHKRPPASVQRRQSTPLSEVKKQAWAWLLRDKTSDGASTSDDKQEQITREQSVETQRQLSNQIDQIQDRLRQQNKSGSSRSSILHLDGSTPQKIASDNEQYSSKISALHDVKDSQANTVEWDDPIDSNVFDGQMSAELSKNFTVRKFMLSALAPAIRVIFTNTITSLGGEISDLPNYDHSATHVICANPTRNEKILSSMAAGKWILHSSYVEESGKTGQFLNEELFEFGNPKSLDTLSKMENLEVTPTMAAMHWWRLKCAETKRGAFFGMRVLIFSASKAAIIRLVEAGDGVILNAEPPFDHNLDVTHCLIDAKKKMNPDLFIPLAEQGIYCLNVLYLSNYLNNKTNIDVHDFIIPNLQDYYK